MSSIIQYLMKQTNEFRESYEQINDRIDELVDKLTVIEIVLKDIEIRVNPNHDKEV